MSVPSLFGKLPVTEKLEPNGLENLMGAVGWKLVEEEPFWAIAPTGNHAIASKSGMHKSSLTVPLTSDFLLLRRYDRGQNGPRDCA